jgi:hypothetical protein
VNTDWNELNSVYILGIQNKSRKCYMHTVVAGIVQLIKLNVRGSVHHSIIHTEIANKMQQCIKIYYSMFIWSQKFFGGGGDTAHHQELKTALTASGFAYVKDCWTLCLLDSVQQAQRPTTFHGIMKNQRLLVQFQTPDDGRCVAWNMLSFI